MRQINRDRHLHLIALLLGVAALGLHANLGTFVLQETAECGQFTDLLREENQLCVVVADALLQMFDMHGMFGGKS